MNKRLWVSVFLVIFCLSLLPAGVHSAGVTSVTLETPSPLEVYAGEPFAVVARIVPAAGETLKFVARSSSNLVMAESEGITGLEEGVAREIILYGKAAKAGLYDISQVEVTDSQGQLIQTLPVDALLVRVLEKPAVEESVTLRMGSFSYTPYVRGEFTLKFSISNSGTAAARDITLRFDSDPAFLRGNTNLLPVPDIPAGTSRNVTVKMGLTNTESPVYRIPITATCTLPNGEKKSFEEVITLTAADLGIKADPVVGTPRVFLKKYTLSSASILAGDTVTLTIYLENSSSREVRNLKVSLTAVPAEGSSGGTVFSPVNSSSSFYIDRIGGKQTFSKSIDLYVDPNAAARTYLVPLEILYEDAQGGSFSVSEMISIPVLQESRLQVLSVDAPFMAYVGQPAPVTAEFVNVGKVALKNLLVAIEGDFPKENASYFLASFEIGQSDYFQGFIIPQQPGPLQGKVVFTYTDNTNQEVVVEMPFQVDVAEGMDRPPGLWPPDDFDPEPPSRGTGFLTWLLPLLLVLVTAGVILWRRRANRGEIFNEEL